MISLLKFMRKIPEHHFSGIGWDYFWRSVVDAYYRTGERWRLKLKLGGCKSVGKRRSKFSTFAEVINEPLGLQIKMKHLLEFIIGQPLTIYKTWKSCKTCTLSFESIMKWRFHYIQASNKQVCNKSMHSLNFEKERYHKSFSQNP